MRSARDKIMTLEEAKAWRGRQMGTVAFTNGVFDLLHPGHVAVLERARGEGDCLIVAVNDDRSVRRLQKGKGRPIMPLASRMQVVAGLEATDCVVSFAEDTPQELVEVLLPDVLVKGSDYEGTILPGAATVISHGGRVVFVPIVPQHSTSTMVERIRAAT